METQTDPDGVVPGFGGGSVAAGGNAAPLCGPWAIATVTVGQAACGVGVGFEAVVVVPDPELEVVLVDPDPVVVPVPVFVTPPVEVVFTVPPQPIWKIAKANSGRNAALRQVPVSKQPPQLWDEVVRTCWFSTGCNLARY